MQKYSVNQYSVESVINWVKSGEIAIPEIQRPFVWNSTKVRDLMDSLYKGYPVGYIISWRNPYVRLKDGSRSEGKKVLIDGQQRVTALTTALVGQEVLDESYNKVIIRIAFHPIEERFEVLNSAIKQDKAWITDISEIIKTDFSAYRFVKNYKTSNPETDEDLLERNIQRLKDIVQRQVGVIELNSELDIDTVTEIFIRINSKGVVLSQADFVMSKIAANEAYGGNKLRKAIDYFCRMAVKPEFHAHIVDIDKEFAATDFFKRMEWLWHENDDLYDPDYNDMLHVACCYKFKRGRLSDLVSLLSGRNFEMRTYEEPIAEASFASLKEAVMTFMNETNFKRFIMIIKSAGFIDTGLINSRGSINFAYVLYLHLKEIGFDSNLTERYVRRWFVMSLLLGRYSSSPESQYDTDIRTISEIGVEQALQDIETAYLGDSYWQSGLPQRLNTYFVISPVLKVFWASQIKMNDLGFLSRDITVKNMIEHRGDIHHIFPRQYLKSFGLEKNDYNQVANYVYIQQEINIKIGDKAPADYMHQIRLQCEGGPIVFGGIDNAADLDANLEAHCIPSGLHEMTVDHFRRFLEERRLLMACKIEAYYKGL
jgi:hypothetical protein